MVLSISTVSSLPTRSHPTESHNNTSHLAQVPLPTGRYKAPVSSVRTGSHCSLTHSLTHNVFTFTDIIFFLRLKLDRPDQ